MIGLAALLLIAAFLAGYIPRDLAAKRSARTLETTELDLRLANLHRQLGVAVAEAQQNDFRAAATTAGEFFAGCRDVGNAYTFEQQPRTRIALAAYAGYAEQVVAQLATGDPAATDRLASLYLTMDGVLKRRE